MNREIKLKVIKISLIIIVTVTIVFSLGMVFLTYHVEGETNLPFKITKITVVSSSEGIQKQDNQNKWALDINQNNDIYIYIEKNDAYGRTEIIDKIKIDNFIIEKEPEIGNLTIYKPEEENVSIFDNKEQNKVSEITYVGKLESDIKKMEISNQGGMVVFRCANDKIGEYISNDGDEINRNALLSYTSITNQQLKAQVSFDISIELISKKVYKANVQLELPVKDIINSITTNIEITDLKDIVFKRIEN